MRTSIIDSQLRQQFALRPVYILKIDWSTGSELYSTASWGSIYGLVKDFSGVEQISASDGLAHTSKVNVTLFDPTGNLKYKFDKENLYSKTLTASLYLGIVNETDKMIIFEGRIEDPIVYDLNTLELKFDVFFGLDKKTVCYVPNIEDIPEDDVNYTWFEKALAGKAWPEVFGSVKNIPIYPLMDSLELKLDEDVNYHVGSTPYEVQVSGDLCSALVEDTFYTINLIGDENGPYIYIIAVKFYNINVDNKTATMKFYNTDEGPTGYFLEYKWYRNIDATKISGDSEDPMQAQLTGTCLKYDGTTVSVDEIFIAEMFGRIHFDQPAGQNMYIERTKDRIASHTDSGIITFNNLNSSEYGDINEIEWVAKSFRVTDKFKKGTRILFYDHPLRGIYICDSKIDSTIEGLYIMGPNGREQIPEWAYIVMDSIADPLWTDNPPCLYVKMKDTDILRTFNNVDMKDRSIQDDDAILGDITSSKNTLGLTVDYLTTRYADYPTWSNATNYTQLVNFALLEEQDLEKIVPEIALQKGYGVRLIYNELEQMNMELVEIFALDFTPVFKFTDGNIDASLFEFSFKDLADIKTKLKGVIQPEDYLTPLKYHRTSNNINQYGELTEDFDYYTYSDLQTANQDIDVIMQYLSTPWAYVTFSGYLDSYGLELYDPVLITLEQPSFYLTSNGSPVDLPSNTVPISKMFLGRVRSIQPDHLNGLIKYTVQLNTGMGGV